MGNATAQGDSLHASWSSLKLTHTHTLYSHRCIKNITSPNFPILFLQLYSLTKTMLKTNEKGGGAKYFGVQRSLIYIGGETVKQDWKDEKETIIKLLEKLHLLGSLIHARDEFL